MNVFGIDIGGSGIKGAPVDTQSGGVARGEGRIKTSHPANPGGDCPDGGRGGACGGVGGAPSAAGSPRLSRTASCRRRRT